MPAEAGAARSLPDGATETSCSTVAKTVTVPLYVGRKDSIDPKLAPMGVLKTCQNVRVRKDGRLAARYGFTPLDAHTTLNEQIQVFDVHGHDSRLLALGTTTTDGYPTQALEYANAISTQPWVQATDYHELSPFMGFRDLDALPPPPGGTDEADSAAGGGFVCVCTRDAAGNCRATIFRDSDGQMVVDTSLVSLLTSHFRVTFSQDTFYIASQRSDNSLDILSCKPTTQAAFSVLKSGAYALSATAPVFDIVPVDNPTSASVTGARVAVALDRSTATDLIIRVYTGTGTQSGSDIAVAGTDTISLSLNADQTANKISLHVIVSGGAGSLRTFNFAGTLLVGSTAVSGGTHGTITRLPPSAAAGSAAQIALVATAGADSTVSFYTEAAHSTTASMVVANAVLTTRVLNWTAAASTNTTRLYSVVFGAYISPVISSTNDATNALFYVTTNGVNVTTGTAHMATRDFIRALPRTMRNLGLHLDSSTSRVAWCALRDSGSGTAQPAITTFPKHSSERRQGVSFGGLRYIAGAPLSVWDGRCLTQPFQDLPGIVSATPSNGAGTLTNSATYTYVVHWEMTLSDGSFWQSAPSDPKAVTMGAADDTVTLVVSTPHHPTVSLGATGATVPAITAVVSRTVYSGGVEGSILRETQTATVPVGLTNYGDSLTITDTTPDTTLATQTAIYTQAARGSLSGCLEHDGPRSCQYLTASESRLYLGGQIRPNQFQASKEAFNEEPFTFSEFSAFFGQVAGRVRGIHSLDQVRLVFTADEIFAVPGGGPDDLGGGLLEAPVRIPSASGLEDWRSLIEAPEGLYFQLDDAQLYQLPRGGGAPAWVGVDVQETLSSYPIVTGACKSRRDDVIVFACQNTTAGTDGRLIVRSLRTGIWSTDLPALTASEGVEAITAFGDRIAYVSGGIVYAQSTSAFVDTVFGVNTAISTILETQPLSPFGPAGYGLIHDLLIDGEQFGAGTLTIEASYDEGASFPDFVNFSIPSGTGAARRRWALPNVRATTIMLRITSAPSSFAAAFISKTVTLLVTPDEGLLEVLPSEAA